LLSAVAAQASVAIDNAQLYVRLEEKNALLEQSFDGRRLRQLPAHGRSAGQDVRRRPGRRDAIDATVVRCLLVPAVMALLGRASWWCPRWLARILPTIDLEGASWSARRPAERPA
jgi:hypothetical protein